eukprot:4023792-Pyramimonas_sp.AAC.1
MRHACWSADCPGIRSVMSENEEDGEGGGLVLMRKRSGGLAPLDRIDKTPPHERSRLIGSSRFCPKSIQEKEYGEE